MTAALTLPSFRNITLGFIGLALSCALFFSVAPQAHASSLTPQQINAILSLLQSFNVDQATIANVQLVLEGQSQPGSNGGSTPLTPASATTTNPLVISTDPSSPAYRVVAGAQTGVTLAVFTLQATGEGITLNKLGFQITSGSADDVAALHLYNGSSLVGNLIFAGGNSTVATSTLLVPLSISPGGTARLTLKADMAGTGITGATAGDLFQVNAVNYEASGQSSATIYRGTASTNTAGVRIFKSYPTVTQVVMPVQTLISGNNESLLRFSITASPAGGIGIGQLAIAESPTQNVTVGTERVYAFTDSAFSQPVSQFPGGLLGTANFAGDVHVVEPSSPLEIPAGVTYYFSVNGDISNLQSNASLSTNLSTDGQAESLSVFKAASFEYNFVWSPNDNSTSQYADSDWTNGFGVPGLPFEGLSQTLTNGTTSPSPRITFDSISGSILTADYANLPANSQIVLVNQTSGQVWPNFSMTASGTGSTTIPIQSDTPAGAYYLKALSPTGAYLAQSVVFYITSTLQAPTIVSFSGLNSSGQMVIGTQMWVTGTNFTSQNVVQIGPYFFGPFPSASNGTYPYVTFTLPQAALSCNPLGGPTCPTIPVQAGTYSMTVRNSNGQSNAVAITLISGTQTTVTFTASPQSGTAPLAVGFNVTGAPGTDIGTTVRFGDGTSGTLNPAPVCAGCNQAASVGHTYASAGTYTATLVNSSGTTLGTATITVTAPANPTITYVSTSGSSVTASYANLPAGSQIVVINQTSGKAVSTISPSVSGSGTLTINNLPPGALYLKALDSSGNYLAQSVVFYITAQTPPPPVATSTPPTNTSCTYAPTGGKSSTIQIQGGASACKAWCSSQALEDNVSYSCSYAGSVLSDSFDPAGMMAAAIMAPFTILVASLTDLFVAVGIGQ